MGRTTRAQRDAAQIDIAEAFEALPENFLDCRDPGIRHQWDKTADFHAIPAEQVGRKLANLARTEECLRCGAVKRERFILVDGRIRKVSQSTDYPDGYLLSGTGVPRGVKRSEVVWSENYRRATEKMAQQANGRKTKTKGKR